MECIIVTGCTSGLGLELHRMLAASADEQRCCVFLGRDLERINQHSKFIYLEVDFSQEYCPQLLLSSLPDNITRITLISNAGMVSPIEQVDSLPSDTFTAAVKVNFVTPAAITSSLAAWTKYNQALFRVINVSSGAANRAINGWASYCATKAGFKMFLDVLSVEQSDSEIVHFDPGVMNTAMQKTIRSSNTESMADVELFVEYKNKNKLNNTRDVATRLLQESKIYL